MVTSYKEQSWIFLIGDDEIWVGLVVLKHAVVAWLVAFDEIVFKQ